MATDVITENTTEQNGTSDNGGPYTGIDDLTMFASVPTTNDETGTILRACAGNPSASSEARSILSFDTGLANITGPVTVTSATVYLNVLGQNSTDNLTITLYDTLQAVNYSQCTWNIYSTGNNWGTAGAKSSGTDYVASALGSATTGTSAPQYWVSITGANLNQAVEDQINGNRTALDILIEATDGTSNARKDFCSVDNTGYVTSRPELVVVYTTGGGGSSIPPLMHHYTKNIG